MILPNMAQPTYPQTNVNVNYPQGIQLNVVLAPGVMLSTTLGPDAVEGWLTMWEQQKEIHKQAQQKELDLIKHLKESKNGHQ